MKKILLTLLLTIFFIPNVYASTVLDNPLDCFDIAPPSSTKNIFLNTSNNWCGYTNNKFYQYSSSDTSEVYLCIDNFIEVQSEQTYTFTHFNSSYSPVMSPKYNYIYIFDENFSQLYLTHNWFVPPYSLNTPANSKYLLYCEYNAKPSFATTIQLELGEITSTDDLVYVPYEEYVEPPEQPDEPDKPIIPDATLDTFYSIYFDKLVSLSNFATENKFVLSAITIVIVVCCLELFLYLVNRRKR